MGEYTVLLTTENECWCGSCQYGPLFWMGRGERMLGLVLKRLTQVSTQVALNCHPGRQLPVFRRLQVGQIQIEREIQHSSPSIPLSSSGTSNSSSSSILHWFVLSEWSQGPGASLGWKVCQIQIWEVREYAMCSCSLAGPFLYPWKASPKYFRDEAQSGN